MLKLSDFAHCHEDTEKRPVVHPCEGFDIEIPCTAHGEYPYTNGAGVTRHFCKLHLYVEMLWECVA